MALVRKRKEAIALAERLANQLLDNNGDALRGARTIEDVRRAIGNTLKSAQQSFHDRVIPERRDEGLLEAAIVAKLELAAAKPAGIAPKVVVREDVPSGEQDVGCPIATLL